MTDNLEDNLGKLEKKVKDRRKLLYVVGVEKGMYFVYLVSFANLKVYEDMTYICVYLFFKNSKQEAIAQRTQTFMPRGDCPAQKREKNFSSVT